MKRIITDNKEMIADFVAQGIGRTQKYVAYQAIGLEEDGQIVAGVVYSEFNGNNIVAAIRGIGKKWMTKPYLFAIFDYPFNVVGAKRITAVIDENNIKSHNFVKKLGFVYEAKLENAGETGDLYFYKMFRDECRYLMEVNHGRHS